MNHAKLGIELTHLRYFTVVAEELHFGRAALKLGVSQPPLTQQIQRLEQRIGFALFERSTRRTSLTEAGNALLPIAQAVLADVDRGIDAAQRAGRGESGQLVVGTPPSVMLAGLPKVIRWFSRKLPDVDLRLREMSTAAIIESLTAGSVDIGFLRCRELPSGLEELFRFRENVVILLPEHHPLAKRQQLKLEHLAEEPFVFFPRRLGAEFYDELLEHCLNAGFTPKVVQEATQWSTIASLVEAGLGVSIGPACISRITAKGCIARPLSDKWTTVMLASPKRRLTATGKQFSDACRTQLGK